VGSLVDAHESIAVARCICRMEAGLEGAGCGRLEEACLSFGDWADYFVREGKGRRITREEARAILAEASREGLVLQPSNSRSAAFICCCCSCCCGVLKRLKLHPRPAEVVVSRFIASFDPAVCVSCSACAERCPMEAVTMGPAGAACFDPVRCIGCGLCVTTCPAGAFRLERKPETPRHRVPETLSAVWREIVADQAAARPGS